MGEATRLSAEMADDQPADISDFQAIIDAAKERSSLTQSERLSEWTRQDNYVPPRRDHSLDGMWVFIGWLVIAVFVLMAATWIVRLIVGKRHRLEAATVSILVAAARLARKVNRICARIGDQVRARLDKE